jgi:hypothetical protein
MTRIDLQNLTLQYLDDLSGGYHTPAIINSWLNLAQKEVNKLLILAHENFYLKCQQTPTVINQAEYILPSDFFMLNMLEIVTGGTAPNENRYSIMPITQNQQYLLANFSSGQPEAYFLKRNTIVLIPTPQTAQTLRMNYHYRVTDMANDSDTPDVPEQYQEMIAIEAALRGFLRDDRPPQMLVNMKENYLKLMKEASEDRRADQPRMITQTSYDSTEQW